MNTKRTVYEKINSINPNVELSQVEIDLATAQDIPQLYGKAVSMTNDLLGDTYAKVNALKNILKEKENSAIKFISELDGALIDFDKKAKDLGLDKSQSKIYISAKKELDDLYKGVKYVTDISKSLK